MQNEVLAIKDLSFSYGEGLLIEGLSLSLMAGEFLTLIGDNGTGKTTLLNLILGRLKPSGGEIRLFGDDIKKNSHYADLAYISQNAVMDYRNFPTTVEEVVRVHLRYLRKREATTGYLEEVGLLDHRHKRLSELSGGQLQRVSLALALIKDARLIILDEPTSNIDQRFSEELFQRLTDMTQGGKSVLLVTHDLAEAKAYSDRLLELKDGRLKHPDLPGCAACLPEAEAVAQEKAADRLKSANLTETAEGRAMVRA